MERDAQEILRQKRMASRDAFHKELAKNQAEFEQNLQMNI